MQQVSAEVITENQDKSDQITQRLDFLIFGPDPTIRSFVKIALDGVQKLLNNSGLSKSSQDDMLVFFEGLFLCIPGVNGNSKSLILNNPELQEVIVSVNEETLNSRLASLIQIAKKGSIPPIQLNIIQVIFQYTFHIASNDRYPNAYDDDLIKNLAHLNVTDPLIRARLEEFKRMTHLFNQPSEL